jgi:hypothetical protein
VGTHGPASLAYDHIINFHIIYTKSVGSPKIRLLKKHVGYIVTETDTTYIR